MLRCYDFFPKCAFEVERTFEVECTFEVLDGLSKFQKATCTCTHHGQPHVSRCLAQSVLCLAALADPSHFVVLAACQQIPASKKTSLENILCGTFDYFLVG